MYEIYIEPPADNSEEFETLEEARKAADEWMRQGMGSDIWLGDDLIESRYRDFEKGIWLLDTFNGKEPIVLYPNQ